jgi:CRISPR-associated protein Csb3
MNEIVLRGCSPDVLLSHLALYGLAAILESAGVPGVRAGWEDSGDQLPYVTAADLTPVQAGEVILAHARAASAEQSWMHRSVTLKGTGRGLMSPRLTPFTDDETWQLVQGSRHAVLDELTVGDRWLDLRLLAALGEPCYWSRDRQEKTLQDNGASRLEMQPRNQGSEFVGNRLRKLAGSVAARDAGQIIAGITGDTVRDEIGNDAPDSRTQTGLAAPGPTDNALAWCTLWGISQLPIAMRTGEYAVAVTTGHLGRSRHEWFYAPVWHAPWRPARMRTILASDQVRVLAADQLRRDGTPVPRASSRGVPADQPGRDRAAPYSDGELAAARRWLDERGVAGTVRFAIQRFGSDSAPERRAMQGEPLSVRTVP